MVYKFRLVLGETLLAKLARILTISIRYSFNLLFFQFSSVNRPAHGPPAQRNQSTAQYVKLPWASSTTHYLSKLDKLSCHLVSYQWPDWSAEPLVSTFFLPTEWIIGYWYKAHQSISKVLFILNRILRLMSCLHHYNIWHVIFSGIQLTLRDYSENRYFTESDVMNVFPIVKHSNPRARDATKLKVLTNYNLFESFVENLSTIWPNDDQN